MNNFLIFGLGNFGEKYRNTRHNIGVDFLKEWIPESFFEDKGEGFLAEASNFLGEGAIYFWSKGFMNNSGPAILPILQKFSFGSEQLIVLHDDFHLPLGKIKISSARGAGGHLGVLSIIESLKTKNFIRIRLGVLPSILPADTTISLKDFVLQKFSDEEMAKVGQEKKLAKEAIEHILKFGLVSAQNFYNNKTD